MKLYEIADNYRNLFDTFNNNDDFTDEETQAFIDTLEGLEGEFEIKAENIACFIKELSGESNLLNDEITALKARKNQKDNLITNLKKMLIHNMQTINVKKIDRPRAKLSLRNNQQSVAIENETDLIKWAKNNNCDLLKFSEPEISKTAVKQAVENGNEIPGVKLVRTVSIIIK